MRDVFKVSKVMELLWLFIYDALLNIFSIFFKPKITNISITSAGGNLYAGNPRYIFEYFLGNKSINIKFLVKNKKLCKFNENIIYFYSFKAFFHILKSKLFIVDCYDFVFHNLSFRKRVIFQTYHGIPIKKIEADTKTSIRGFLFEELGILRFFTKKNYKEYVVSGSKYYEQFLQSAFPNAVVVTLGYPRNDILFSSAIKKHDSYKGYKKVILYAPTWRNIGWTFKPFSKSFLNKLNKFLKLKNYLFLIKNHPKMDKALNSSFSNIKDITKGVVNNINELYCQVDVLISDYSSVSFDFVLLDRPIIFYIKDIKDYLKMCPAGFYVDFKRDLPGPFVYTEESLLKKLKNIDLIFDRKSYQVKYANFKKLGYDFQNGYSAKRVCNYILKNIINFQN